MPTSQFYQDHLNRDTTQHSVYEFIVQYKSSHDGNSPSLRRIADDMCMSVVGVHYIVSKMIKAGRLYRDAHRNLCVPGGLWHTGKEQYLIVKGKRI